MINVKKVIDNLLEKEENEEISVKCEFKDGFLKCADGERFCQMVMLEKHHS